MSKAKFTQGPWSLRGNRVEQVESGDGLIQIRLIATVNEGCLEHRANARLLLAAPALYRALSLLLDETAYVTPCPHHLVDAKAVARAALAQADVGVE